MERGCLGSSKAVPTWHRACRFGCRAPIGGSSPPAGGKCTHLYREYPWEVGTRRHAKKGRGLGQVLV